MIRIQKNFQLALCALISFFALEPVYSYAETASANGVSILEKEFIKKCANVFAWTNPGAPMSRSDLLELENAAEEGVPDAQFCRGALLMRGVWLPKDEKAALELFKKSADAGNPHGMAAYAVCMQEGRLLSADPKKADAMLKDAAAKGSFLAAAEIGKNFLKRDSDFEKQMGFELLKESAELGNVYAKTVLASCYDRGSGIKADKSKASELLKEAAEQGNAPALFALGMLNSKNNGDVKTTFKYYEKAAQTNYPPALSALGVCYLYGAGVAPNYEKAVSLLNLAADSGVVEAMNALAICHANGAGVEESPQKAFECFRRAAELGDNEAQNNLGNCYYFGKGVSEDHAQAQKWYERSALQGNVAAQSSLALLFLEGKSKDVGAKEAAVWLLRAAEGGDLEAQSNLGKCFLDGIVFEQNYELAVKWLSIAAAKNDAQALGNLGGCYYLGLGVEKDVEKAKELIKRAAKLGNEEARKAYNRISGE